jgi:hypothetical protein
MESALVTRRDRIQIVALLRIELRIKHQRRHPHDRIHRRANPMAHIRQKIALCLIRVFGDFFRSNNCVLRHTLLRNISASRNHLDHHALFNNRLKHLRITILTARARHLKTTSLPSPCSGVIMPPLALQCGITLKTITKSLLLNVLCPISQSLKRALIHHTRLSN